MKCILIISFSITFCTEFFPTSSVMTMEQLLENLIKKTVTECMESHRNMIAAMNGQAGIHLIEDPPKVRVVCLPACFLLGVSASRFLLFLM